jgi:hypothetical protein
MSLFEDAVGTTLKGWTKANGNSLTAIDITAITNY